MGHLLLPRTTFLFMKQARGGREPARLISNIGHSVRRDNISNHLQIIVAL
jgi:hypothetical protein